MNDTQCVAIIAAILLTEPDEGLSISTNDAVAWAIDVFNQTRNALYIEEVTNAR